MYLHKIRLKNIKCFENIEFDFTYGRNKPRLMTVILGDNGVGKTTLLQAIAIVFGKGIITLSPGSLNNWVRVGHERGHFRAIIYSKLKKDGSRQEIISDPIIFRNQGHGLFTHWPEVIESLQNDELACGYGPSRRFTDRRISEAQHTPINRVASLFGQNNYLIPVEDWLIELDRRALIAERESQSSNDRQLFNQVAQALLKVLPEENQKKIAGINVDDPSSFVKTTKEGILWRDSFGNWVTLSHLSDGYQSTMSLVGDLVSRLSGAFLNAKNLLKQEGIVLIDEVDIHLHPTWQRKILNQLRQTFPNIQFIVTTHSPLVAASAKEGELFVLKEEQNHVIVESVSSVQGWRADQILTSSLFDLDTTRDPETEQQLARYDELLAIRASGELSADQTQELAILETELGKKLPTGETPEQRQLYQEMRNYITQTLREKGE